VAVSPLLVSASQTDQNLTLQWFGTGVLQTSTDLNTWSNLTSVFSPYSISTGGQQGGLKFYRLIFSPR
jgi:hypothetical protein